MDIVIVTIMAIVPMCPRAVIKRVSRALRPIGLNRDGADLASRGLQGIRATQPIMPPSICMRAMSGVTHVRHVN